MTLMLASACQKGPALSKHSEVSTFETPSLGPIGSDRLGVLLDQVPVYAGTSKNAPRLGFLHAGTELPRSSKNAVTPDCEKGWYQLAPRGYVCADEGISLNLDHPTLKAMALRPELEKPLPYVYGKLVQSAPVYEKTHIGKALEPGVKVSGRLSRGSGVAIVGSWTAPDESKEPIFLGLRMNGQFVATRDLAPAPESQFQGVRLGEGGEDLPLAFVVRRGVSAFRWTAAGPKKARDLEYHERLSLTGRYRSSAGHQYWALPDDLWVRHQDVTMIHKRGELPEFAKDDQKWIDVSVITGIMVLYEGTRPVYATLASVGRDRLGDPKTTASTERGTFRVVSKQITRRAAPETTGPALEDAPWALELESGQWLTASPLHDRFGIENTDGDIEVSPRDGAFVWNWATPNLPQGWHGVQIQPGDPVTLVNIRK
jgi:hypothetical protein